MKVGRTIHERCGLNFSTFPSASMELADKAGISAFLRAHEIPRSGSAPLHSDAPVGESGRNGGDSDGSMGALHVRP